MKIVNVDKKSTAAELGLQAGDDIVSINGHQVRDVLDYRFLIAEEEIEMEVLKSGLKVVFDIEKDYDDTLGLELEEIEIRHCGNDCPFCFVDQNPAGMRDSMYFRDEDFRLSFLSGHYVTLTNLSKRDIDRIVWQRLSPIFVSVHATDPEIRRFLFGIEHDDRLLDKLEFLTKHDIEIHAQVVLCPEVNDGAVLEKTIRELAAFQPNLRSVSVVPVGLTRHREGLTKLKPVSPEYARDFLRLAEKYAIPFLKRTGEHFVYAADEFYIMAGAQFPESDRYDGFYQKENGVGMVRFLLDDFRQQKTRFPKRLASPKKATLVTARLASGFIRDEIIPGLASVMDFEPRLAVIENRFYGDSIGVTGLLTGQDIYTQLQGMDLGDRVYLPANCLKDNRLFLDDWTIGDMSTKLGCAVEPLADDFSRIFQDLEN